MSFSDLLIKQVVNKIAQQIDQDIMDTMFNGSVVSNKAQSSALTEQLINFAYDETIDDFVYAFMDNDKFSEEEKNILYDFGQLLAEQLNIHRMCTFLPLNNKSKFPMMEKYSLKDDWYKNYVNSNTLILNQECSMSMLAFAQSSVDRNRLMELWVRNVVNELHGQFVKYLKKEATLLKNVEIDPFGDMTSLDFYGGPKRFPTLQNFNRELSIVIQTKKIYNPWIMGTGLNFSFMKDYFQNDFMISPLQETSKQSGICIEGTYKPVLRSNSSLTYISHNGVIEDKQEDIIIGNGNSTINESLVAGMEMIPITSINGDLGVKIRLFLIKNPEFLNNYLKMPLKYKTL